MAGLESLLQNKNAMILLVSASSFTAGTTVGALYAARRLEPKYAALAAKEIDQAKRYYSILHKTGTFSSPTTVVEQKKAQIKKSEKDWNTGLEILKGYQGNILEELEEQKEEVKEVPYTEEVRNVFVDAEIDDEFDYDHELKHRRPGHPYVVSFDEYMEGKPGYDQTTITYFEGDDVLLDERDQVIDEVDAVVGIDNLRKFGHGSKDNKIVYIRNERIELDFEVVRSQGKYSEEVLGFIEHSKNHHRRPRRFRGDDE